MASPGFVTHVDASRRSVAWLVAIYVLAFQLVGGLAGTIFIQLWDPANTLLVNPLGYFVRYGLPVGAISLAIFLKLYFSHANVVAKALSIRPLSRLDEPRLVRIAEEQCIALGIRKPRFGIIEVPQPNALAVGEGPDRGMIAVTRGLLDLLDDEELATVLAHEASHIRNGDTRILAANHALMRTAVLLQVNNPLRFEDWRQLIIPLLLPPFMLILLMSGFITMCSMKLAREARRGINLARDFIADADAVRVTHFPDALASALRKLEGRGAFPSSGAFEDILFEGRSSGDGGSHPDVSQRLAAITHHAGSMMDPGRHRRDTRAPMRAAAGSFGRKGLVSAPTAAGFATMPPVPAATSIRREKPETIANEKLLWMWLTDRQGYRAHTAAMTDYYEWRESDDRNIFGIRPELRIPVAMAFAFLLVFHWPSDGDYRTFAYKFSPSYWADIGVKMNNGPFCSGPSYPDGKCPQ
jgi:heat shock protein HtpX